MKIYCHYLAAAFLLVIVGCRSAQKTAAKQELEEAKPEWVLATPTDLAYYHGIGHSTKIYGQNYMQEAKKSALEDIISQIKVSVRSTATLSQLDTDKAFTEKYQQIVETTAAEELEDFETAGVWEDSQAYWVYYRLSKARYKQLQEEKKRNAVTLALEFFTKAKQAEQRGEIANTLSFYCQSFQAMEKYLGNPLKITYEGQEISLVSEVINGMQKMLANIELNVVPPQINVNRRVSQTNNMAVTVRATLKNAKTSPASLPLIAAFQKGGGEVLSSYKTDTQGQVRILINKITSNEAEQQLAVRLDLTAFSVNNPSQIYSLMVGKFIVPQAVAILHVKKPVVLIASVEKIFGAENPERQIANTIANFLTESGFEITQDPKKAELLFSIQTDVAQGKQSGGIFVADATTAISVKDPSGKAIYAATIDRIKGHNLDYVRAARQAYDETVKQLQNTKLPELLHSIL